MGENFCELVEIFYGEKVADCSLVLLKDATPRSFVNKTFTNGHKRLKFAKLFSLASVLINY